jgi:hypothetical protein
MLVVFLKLVSLFDSYYVSFKYFRIYKLGIGEFIVMLRGLGAI